MVRRSRREDFLRKGVALKPAIRSLRVGKVTRTALDTIEVTPDTLRSWQIPPFQRPLRVNEKVRTLAETVAQDDGVIPGVMTIGVLKGVYYLLDGQHRREAFFLSECKRGYVDIRIHHFDSMAEMGEEFVNLNSQIVRMRPDDILRGLEGTIDSLQLIKKRCPFVGYDQIRRGSAAPIVSMSALIRCWVASATEVPRACGESAQHMALQLSTDEAETLCDFAEMAFNAWGRDQEYHRLWGGLNLTLCMWLYRRLVISQYSPNTTRITKDVFRKCLMSVSAASDYVDWLVGRMPNDRDRSPCYMRLKPIFVKRIEVESNHKTRLPAPAWASK